MEKRGFILRAPVVREVGVAVRFGQWINVQFLTKQAHPEEIKSETIINYDNNALRIIMIHGHRNDPTLSMVPSQ